MDILRSYRRIRIEKREKRMSIIKKFLSNEMNKNWINTIIAKSISPLNKRYFGESDLIDMLEFDIINGDSYLRSLKEECYSVAIFNQHGILNFIVEFNDFKKDKSFFTRLKLYLSDLLTEDEITSSYKKVKEKFFKDKKSAEKIYSTALNKYTIGDKIFYLKKALKKAPWGSVVSIKIIQALILIKSGEILGKTEKDFKLETKNIEKQKKI